MNPSAPPGPTASRGRPRSADTDRRIHAAALCLLRDHGPERVTMEAVAAASGVAKTTIYRRYSDREALLHSALAEVVGQPVAQGSTTREKVRWSLQETWRQMTDVLGPGGLAALVAGTDPRFTRLCRSVLDPYDEALVALVRADVDAGALRADVDPDAAVSLLVGAYLGELVRRGAVDDGFLERCLDLMWVAMVATD